MSNLEEDGAGYTFYYIGKSRDQPHQSGVGFAIQSVLAQKLESLPKGINDGLMVLWLCLSNNELATLTSTYAPMMTHKDDSKEAFYDDLIRTIREIPHTDINSSFLVTSMHVLVVTATHLVEYWDIMVIAVPTPMDSSCSPSAASLGSLSQIQFFNRLIN